MCRAIPGSCEMGQRSTILWTFWRFPNLYYPSSGCCTYVFHSYVVASLLFFKTIMELGRGHGNGQVTMSESSLVLLRFSHFTWVNTPWIVVSFWITSRILKKKWFWQFCHCSHYSCGGVDFQKSLLHLFSLFLIVTSLRMDETTSIWNCPVFNGKEVQD